MFRPPTPPAAHRVVASSEQHKQGEKAFRLPTILFAHMTQEALTFHPKMSDQTPASQQPGSSMQTTTEAYECLNIADTSISDGDVVVAFYKAYSVQRDLPGGAVLESVNALESIAGSRRSKWLAFTRTILPHLTETNVSILESRSQPAPNFRFSADVNNEQSDDAPAVQETMDPTTPFSRESFIFRAAADPIPPREPGLSAYPTLSRQSTSPTVSAAMEFDSHASMNLDVSDSDSNYSEGLSLSASSSDYDSVLSEISQKGG